MAVIAISADPIEELASWAADSDFPQLFASDPEGGSFRAFGVGVRDSGVTGSRMVAVVDPDGVVSYTAAPFREIDPAAYEELAEAVQAVAPPLEEAEGDDAAHADGGTDGLTQESRDLELTLQALLGAGDC